MERSWWMKFLFLIFTVVMAGMYVYPTLTNMDFEKTDFPIQKKVHLGLDLQGGLYMVLGVDFNQVFGEVVERQKTSLESRMKEKGLNGRNFKVLTEGFDVDDRRISFDFDPAEREKVYKLIKDEFWSLRLTNEKEGHFELGLARDYRADVRDKTLDQSIEVIRNRIDEFGVSEPTIASQGTDRLIVELPGVKDVKRAKALIGRTAKLEFRIVNDEAEAAKNLPVLIEEIEKENKLEYKEDEEFSAYVRSLNQFAKGKIPADSEISFELQRGPDGTTLGRVPYLLFKKADVTGEDLQDAQVSFNPEKRTPEVAFEMNPRGAVLFGDLTEKNTQKRLAIVLDNIVHSAPVINSKITSRGVISLGSGNYDSLQKEAKDLAIVLRAGALPARLEFMQERVVGPSLGADSVEKGATAGLIGALCVFLFIAVYYRGSGLIAVFSLMLNVIFVLAVLVGLEATLTLPGIAGIALTVGIAVDSNVVIYERIREELRAGKMVHGAVEAGFQKAFRTILDANVTNAAAAIVLLTYGTGPIKGFAVTMLIGILATLFTAVFVCRLLFELILSSKGQTRQAQAEATLSI